MLGSVAAFLLDFTSCSSIQHTSLSTNCASLKTVD